jgi:hypothetical protein
VEVEVVAVGGVDVLAQVEAGVRQRQLHVGHPRGDPAGGALLPRDRPLRLAQHSAGVEAQPRQPGLGERVVVVARHQHHRPPRERPPELLEHRAGDLERVGEWPLAQLNDVAEQHHPVRPAERLYERLAPLSITRDVRAAEGAEVKVGDE